jgi:hypothetical protein
MGHGGTTLTTWKTVLGTGVLAAGISLFGGPTEARADDCQERIVRADHQLHEAVHRHGWQSKQADHARHELREARQYCWEHGHRWWNVEEDRWHTDRDWDDHDHDRDHDRR